MNGRVGGSHGARVHRIAPCAVRHVWMPQLSSQPRHAAFVIGDGGIGPERMCERGRKNISPPPRDSPRHECPRLAACGGISHHRRSPIPRAGALRSPPPHRLGRHAPTTYTGASGLEAKVDPRPTGSIPATALPRPQTRKSAPKFSAQPPQSPDFQPLVPVFACRGLQNAPGGGRQILFLKSFFFSALSTEALKSSDNIFG